jgi:hypothetical protein
MTIFEEMAQFERVIKPLLGDVRFQCTVMEGDGLEATDLRANPRRMFLSPLGEFQECGHLTSGPGSPAVFIRVDSPLSITAKLKVFRVRRYSLILSERPAATALRGKALDLVKPPDFDLLWRVVSAVVATEIVGVKFIQCDSIGPFDGKSTGMVAFRGLILTGALVSEVS